MTKHADSLETYPRNKGDGQYHIKKITTMQLSLPHACSQFFKYVLKMLNFTGKKIATHLSFSLFFVLLLHLLSLFFTNGI